MIHDMAYYGCHNVSSMSQDSTLPLCDTACQKNQIDGAGPATPVTQALSDMRLPTSRRVLERMTASTWFVNVRAASLLWH